MRVLAAGDRASVGATLVPLLREAEREVDGRCGDSGGSDGWFLPPGAANTR